MELTVSELPYDEQVSVLSRTSRSVSPPSFLLLYDKDAVYSIDTFSRSIYILILFSTAPVPTFLFMVVPRRIMF